MPPISQTRRRPVENVMGTDTGLEGVEDQCGRISEFGDQGWRIKEFGDQGWSMREFGDQGAENKTVETWRAEQQCRVQKGITELHRSLDSAVKFGPGVEVPSLGASREPADGSSGQNLGWKLCVKDKWVKLDSRNLDPEWRDSAGRAKKGNNGSRRPYISRGVKD